MMHYMPRIMCLKCGAVIRFSIQKQLRLFSSVAVATPDYTTKYERPMESEKKDALSEDNICEKRQRVVETLKALGFNDEDIDQAKHYKKYTNRIENNFMVLEEYGVKPEKITIKLMSYFHRKKRLMQVDQLTKEGLLEPGLDITRNILSFSDLPRELYPSERLQSKFLFHHQREALTIYFCWRLECTREEIEKRYPRYKPLVDRSIRMIQRNIDILTKDIGMPLDKVKHNLYLLLNNPKHILKILDQIAEIGGMPVREAVVKNPKLLQRPVENILESMRILQEYDIPLKALALFTAVLTLSTDTLRHRLQSLYSDPYYRPFFNNPRIFKCVIYYNKVIQRAQLLTKMKSRCQSLDLLSMQEPLFQVRVRLGADGARGNDTIHFLGKQFNMKGRELREMMNVHPYWRFIPVCYVAQTLQYLQEAGFDRSHIIAAMPIICYPRKDVEQCMSQLDTLPENESCQDPQTGRIRKDLILNLILYYLEKPYHFTGDGIWGQGLDVSSSSWDHMQPELEDEGETEI